MAPNSYSVPRKGNRGDSATRSTARGTSRPTSNNNSRLVENQNQQHPSKSTSSTENNPQFPLQNDSTRAVPGDKSKVGVEAESLSNSSEQQSTGLVASKARIEKTDVTPDSLDDEDLERSNWVHRDKLAMIESREAREIGIKIPRKSETTKADVNDLIFRRRYDDETSSASPADQPASNEKHLGVQIPQFSADAAGGEDSHFYQDPRTPEEILADPYEEESPQHIQPQQSLRSSSSRIPVSKTSPLPIAQQHLERSTPLPRRRGPSGDWDEDRILYKPVRSRSQSVGSQVLLDDGELQINGSSESLHTASQMTPTKTGQASKPRSASGARKTAGLRNSPAIQKPGSTTVGARASPSQRPVTRDGRPATAMNRPEGDPPWLATMYKPDPHLPPDQQILPTHAKRLQQEQWAKEGKYGVTFDRDFNPLAVHPNDNHPVPPEPASASEPKSADEHSAAWPLRANPAELTKPTIGTEHAGYSTIPNVQSTPPIGPLPSPRLLQPMETVEPIKQEKKARGCNCCKCCIVM